MRNHPCARSRSAVTSECAEDANGNVFLLGYSLKKADVNTFKIASVEKFMDKYNYYIFSKE